MKAGQTILNNWQRKKTGSQTFPDVLLTFLDFTQPSPEFLQRLQASLMAYVVTARRRPMTVPLCLRDNKSTLVVLVVALFCLTSLFSQNVGAAEPSAQAIIERAKAAMESTMKYQISAAGGAATTVVYQKALTNGTMASRSETSSGDVKLTYLFSSGRTYQLFPDAHAAIDMSFLEQIGQSPSVNPFARVSLGTAEWKGFTTCDDKTCYKIQVHLVPMDTNQLAAMLQQAKANNIPIPPFPDACEYLIETNTSRVLQMTMLHGDSKYAKVEFKDFGILPDLPDDFFIIQADYTIEKAASLEEYSHMMMNYLVPPPKNIPKGFAFDPKTHHIVKVDPKTGAFIPLNTNIVASSAYQLSASGQNGIRIIILSILVVSSVGFLVVIIINQYRRKKSD
jgi:hypothetical protein